jgi:Calx-beta domain
MTPLVGRVGALLAGLFAVNLAASAWPAAEACASQHIAASLAGFPPEAVSRPAYFAEEPSAGASNASFTVRVYGDECNEPMIRVDYATGGGTALPGADFDPKSGTAQVTIPIHSDATHTDAVSVKEDAETEAVTESTDIVLSNPNGARLAPPFIAPLLIIDSDGPPRVAFDGSPYSQSESNPVVRIPVFRAGSVSGSTLLGYSIDPSGDTPASRDHDYTPSTGTISFGPGERVKTVDFSVVNDQFAEAPETVTISLNGSEPVSPKSTTFTILDNEEGNAPTSKLHHPRHRWRYPFNDYRIREIHVFTKDEQGGSGVVHVELALRRTMTNGKCAWWNGKRFQGGDCSKVRWRPTKAYEPGNFYYYRIKALAPSVGTRVKNYTAYARAIDGAGNVESLLQPRRNRNTFEVKRKG